MRVLVFGVGAIGSLMVHYLCKAGNDVTVVARSTYEELKLIKETDMEEACYLWIETYEKPSQKFSTYREKVERNVRLYAESIQEECTYDMDRGNILWPVPSVKVGSVTSKFGYRGNIGVPVATSDHKGNDIGAAEGSNIVAVASGTVKTVAYDDIYMCE